MRSLCVAALALLTLAPGFRVGPAHAADVSGGWAVREAELIYEVSHVLHVAQGRTSDVRGSADCDAQRCTFRFTAPLRSFDSGDIERDRDMLEATRAGRHPEVVVEGTGRLVEDGQAVVEATVRLAGGEATLKPVRFRVERGWWSLAVRGRLVIALSDFGIERPALLSVPIADAVRVYVRLTLGAR